MENLTKTEEALQGFLQEYFLLSSEPSKPGKSNAGRQDHLARQIDHCREQVGDDRYREIYDATKADMDERKRAAREEEVYRGR